MKIHQDPVLIKKQSGIPGLFRLRLGKPRNLMFREKRREPLWGSRNLELLRKLCSRQFPII